MSVQLGDAIAWKYPDADNYHDYRVQIDDPKTGEQVLVFWNVKDSNGNPIPQPTQDDINQWMFSCAQKMQIKQVYNDYIANCFTTFKSSGTGTEYTYLADQMAKTRYDAVYARFHNDSTYTSEDIYTVEKGDITHTADQFIQVWTDGFNNEKALSNQYQKLAANIRALQLSNYSTIDDALAAIEAIVWVNP